MGRQTDRYDDPKSLSGRRLAKILKPFPSSVEILTKHL